MTEQNGICKLQLAAGFRGLHFHALHVFSDLPMASKSTFQHSMPVK